MYRVRISILAALFILILSGELLMAETKLKDGLYAKFVTEKGDILCVLEFEKTPLTVANFVGLAEGTKELSSGVTGTKFYDDLTFGESAGLIEGQIAAIDEKIEDLMAIRNRLAQIVTECPNYGRIKDHLPE